MYQVVGNDAQIYGPVNIDVLQTWIAEGKLARHTVVIDPITGQSGPAEMMLRDWDLFPVQSPPPHTPPFASGPVPPPPYPAQSYPPPPFLSAPYGYPMPGVRVEADIGSRLLGYLIDLAIGLPLGFMAGVPFLGIIAAPLFCGYWLSRDSFFNGQSIGKRALKIRVVRLDGGPVGWGQSALRNLMYLWGILMMIPVVGDTAIGFLGACATIDAIMVLISRRRVGDYLAGTMIVKEVG